MEQWETLIDIRAAVEEVGFRVSRDQLERWRNRGLLPKVRQIGKGRGAGSEVRYPAGTAQQALMIAKLLSIKEKFDFVGWELWLRGYPVDERFWLHSIESAFLNMRRIPAYLRLMQWRHRDDSSTIFDRLDIGPFRKSPIGNALMRLRPDLKAYILGSIADIATGKFTGFASADDRERWEHLRSFLAIAGIPQGRIAGKVAQALGFDRELERQLIAISSAFADVQGSAGIALDKLSPIARVEFSDAMEVARALHLILRNTKRSLFRTAIAILASNRATQAYLILIWCYFRTKQTIMPSDDIRELAELTFKSLDKMAVSR